MKTLKPLLQLLSALRRLEEELTVERGKDISLRQAIVFLAVAEAGDNGTTVGELTQHVGISSSAMSRVVSTLSDYGWRKKPGLGLIEVRPDYVDRRRKPVYLTDKGKKALKRVLGSKA